MLACSKLKIIFTGKLVSIQRKEKSLSVCMNGQGVNHNSTIVNNDVKSQSTETEVEKEKEEPRRKNQSSCVALEQETRSTSPCRNRSTSPVPATSELSPHKVLKVLLYSNVYRRYLLIILHETCFILNTGVHCFSFLDYFVFSFQKEFQVIDEVADA